MKIKFSSHKKLGFYYFAILLIRRKATFRVLCFSTLMSAGKKECDKSKEIAAMMLQGTKLLAKICDQQLVQSIRVNYGIAQLCLTS